MKKKIFLFYIMIIVFMNISIASDMESKIVYGPVNTDLYESGQLFFKKNNDKIKPIDFMLSYIENCEKYIEEIDSYPYDGQVPVIESVFPHTIYNNINIVVIVSWLTLHRAEGIHGTTYQIYFYKKDKDNNLIRNEVLIQDSNLRGFDGYNQYGDYFFKYKNKNELKKYLQNNYK